MNAFRHLAIVATASAAVLALAAASVHARAAEPAKPLALRGVMQQLDHDMQAITGAIASEDWTAVTRLAPKIARHAEPPLTEKVRILAWLGSDAGKFRGFDGQVHDAAVAMGEAAQRSDGQAVITAFSDVQRSCLACHRDFRSSFKQHFYGTP